MSGCTLLPRKCTLFVQNCTDTNLYPNLQKQFLILQHFTVTLHHSHELYITVRTICRNSLYFGRMVEK
jgi:hypothetical protein